MKIMPLERKFFQSNQAVTATLQNDYGDKAKITLTHRDGSELPVMMQKEKTGDETKIKFIPPSHFKPGRYTLKITDEKNNSTVQDFSWGVLAINPNKSVYYPHETAFIAIGILDEMGVTLCDVKTSLEITSAQGEITTLGTWDQSIRINKKTCGTREVTYIPDYETEYKIGNVLGTYKMVLTAETQNGPFTVYDSFEVKDDIPFDVERFSATRIFPINRYSSLIKIKANQDFAGQVTEIVPADFEIFPNNEENAVSYHEVATFSAVLNQNYQVLGAKLRGILTSPLREEFPISQNFANVPVNPLLKTEYERGGAQGHDGVDFAVPMDTAVYAIDEGTVYHAGLGPYGKTVIIDHVWGRSYYGHLNDFKIKIGQTVKKGDLIALSGTSGLSTGPHLHLTVRPADEAKDNGYNGAVDPLKYLANAVSTQENSATNLLITKKLIWNLDFKKDQTITLGYQYKAPTISPQFYLLGPISFHSPRLEENESGLTFVESLQSSPSANFNQSGQASSSASSSSELFATPNYQLPISNYQTVYQVSRQWQIASDADVLIDATVAATTNNNKNKKGVVFISDLVGYVFYTNAGGASCVYQKTTNGGSTWNGEVALTSGSETSVGCEGVSVWYDQWTPSDISGTYIHVAFMDTTGMDLYYERIDTANSDTQLGQVIIDSTATTLVRNSKFSITKSTSGILYAALSDNDSGVSKVRQCNIATLGCESIGDWSNVGTSPLDSTLDAVILMPMKDGNIMLIRWVIAAEDIQYRYWDGSDWDNPTAGWSDIDTNATDNGTTDPNTFNATVRRFTYDLYLAYVDLAGTNDTAEIRTQLYNGSSWSQKTDVVCSASDGNCTDALGASEALINLDIALDEESGDVYVSYLRGSATSNNLYYKKSTDSMANWSSQSSALNSSVTDNQNHNTMLNVVDSERIFFVYEDDANNDYYGGTVVNLTPPIPDEIMKHGEWWSRVGKRKAFSF